MAGNGIAMKPSSVIIGAIVILGVLTIVCLHTLLKEAAHLSDSETYSATDSVAFLQTGHIQLQQRGRGQVQTIQLRGHIQIDRDALTEGPANHPGKENLDSIEHYFPHETGLTSKGYIVGWKPLVNQHKCPDGTPVELVHHMNVLNLDPSHAKELQQKKTAAEPFSSWDSENWNTNIVASYDRGAAEYHLPQGYGIPFDKIVLEYHLLMPKCWDYKSQPIETSGIDLYVTSERPEHLAGLVGITDESMAIAPGSGMIDHMTLMKTESLQRLFTPAALTQVSGGSQVERSRLQLLAVHLHTHDISLSKSFEVLNPDGSTLFQSQDEKTGYGPTQNFLSPREKGWTYAEIQPGQSYRVHCKFDKSKLHETVLDGVNHGEEMCSALLLIGGPSSFFAPVQDSIISANEGFVKLLGRALETAFVNIKGDIHRLIW